MLTGNEIWTLLHGMGLGGFFLLTFTAVLYGLWTLQPELMTPNGLRERLRMLNIGTSLMAVAVWLTVITGTYVLYPRYRAPAPDGATDLSAYPRSFLKANDTLAFWHSFGMEWKEHVAWIAPILATIVAYIVWRYGEQLANDKRLRQMTMILFVIAIVAVGIAGIFGALITKNAPLV